METGLLILNALLGAGIIQGLLLAFLFFSQKTEQKRANTVLAFLMLAFSLNIAHPLLMPGLVSPALHVSRTWNEVFQFLFGPMVFLYIREISGRQVKFGFRDVLHFIPFFLSSGFLILEQVIGGRFLDQYINPESAIVVDAIFWGCIIIQLSIYIILCFKNMFHYRHALEDEFSAVEKRKLDWMHFFLFFFLGITILYIVFLALHLHGHFAAFFTKINALVLSVAVYGIGYRGLKRSELLLGKSVGVREAPDNRPAAPGEGIENKSPEKYQKSGLTDQDLDAMSEKLKSFLSTRKPYLDPEISLSDLASLLGLSRNQLSLVINEKFGMTFYNLINSYRLEEAKKILQDPAKNQDKILTVALDAGFNSKAVFNKYFKKVTSQTPREYKIKVSTEVREPKKIQSIKKP